MNSLSRSLRPSLLLVLFLLMTFSGGCMTASRVYQLPVTALEGISPEILNQAVPDTTAYMTKYAVVDGVLLSVRETIEHSVSTSMMFKGMGDWTYSYLQQRRYMIFNLESSDLTSITLENMPDKFYAVVSTPSGVKKSYLKKDLVPFKITDSDTDYRLTFAGLERGSVVTYGFENSRSTTGFVPYDYRHWLEYRLPVESLTISFNYPDWWTVQVQETGNGVRQRVQEIPHPERKKTELRYVGFQIPAMKFEPYSPPEFWRRPRLEYQLTRVEVEGNWSRESVWNELFTTVKKYNQTAEYEGSPAIRALSDSLKMGTNNLTELAGRIVDYIRHTIDHDDKGLKGKLESVVRLKKGDNFDKFGLTLTLFRQARVSADLYALTSSYDGPFDNRYINWDQFDGFAVYVTDGKDSLLVYPTAKSIPVNFILPWHRGQPAMKVEERYMDKFVTVIPPRTTLDEPELEVDIHLTVDSVSGTVAVREKLTYTGAQSYDLKNFVLPRSGANRTDSLKRLISFYGADMRDYKFTMSNDSFLDLPVVMEFSYTVTNLLAETTEEKVLQIGDLFNPVLSFVRGGKPDTLNRIHPLWINSPSRTHRAITINFPESWEIVTAIPDDEFTNEIGRVHTTTSLLNGQIRLEQQAQLNQVRLPKERITDLAALITAGEKAAISSLVFGKKK